ncbi:hypothetical protein HNY73_006512 [Argiope bruennichi]|uniref:Uncharacterized protein n=1 Tax=Argiope bruennichi TaxID=94029 RepID=A0A8T0FB54_ARGBR|nr:hypothetical protein HNY73_006512 [Argiope bruennichi]
MPVFACSRILIEIQVALFGLIAHPNYDSGCKSKLKFPRSALYPMVTGTPSEVESQNCSKYKDTENRSKKGEKLVDFMENNMRSMVEKRNCSPQTRGHCNYRHLKRKTMLYEYLAYKRR